MEDVIEYPPQTVPRPPCYLYLCLFLVSPNFLPNPYPHKPPRHLPPATPLWQPLVSLRPKSRPAEDHQRWQWQIYSSTLHERYIFRIYISTWQFFWISPECEWIQLFDHGASSLPNSGHLDWEGERDVDLRNAGGLLPWIACLDSV